MKNNNKRKLKSVIAGLTVLGLATQPTVAHADQLDRLRDTISPQPIQPAPPPQPIQPDPPEPEPESRPAPAESGGSRSTPSRPQPSSRPQPVVLKPVIRKIDFAYVQFGVLGKTDTVAANRYYHVYTFEGKANQPIEIRLVGSNDSRLKLTPAMFLYGPKGNEIIGRRFTEGDAVRSAFMFMRLPQDGTYTVIVTSQEERAIGRYSLALRDDRTSYLLDRFGELSDRSPKLKQEQRAFETVEFRGRQDQFINIRVDSLKAEFLPLVYLINSKGKIITTSRDDNNLYRVRIERSQLPEDDTYQIVVSSVRPNGRGRFRVSVY